MQIRFVLFAEVGVVAIDPVLAGRVEDVEVDGVFERVRFVREIRWDAEDFAGANGDFLVSGLGLEDELQRALEDVADLFVVVMMQGDDRSLFEQDAGDHDIGPDEELAADEGIELLDRDVVPVGVRELVGGADRIGLAHGVAP